MKKPGKNTLIRSVQQFIHEQSLVVSGNHLILAVSGGIDSMVLLDVMAKLQRPFRLKLAIAHVNYQLRGSESDKDEAFVKKTALRYRIPLYTKRIDAGLKAKQRKRSIQETARDIRYSFFDTLKEKLNADAIVTAHHSDDNTETVLINLIRGSGVDGLAGIPIRRDSIIRPLLCADRGQIQEYAAEYRIHFRNDASNKKEEYTRNFLRNTVIPAVKKRINPSLNETLGHTSTVLRSVSEFLNAETDRVFKRSVKANEIPVKPFMKHQQIIQQSVIRRLLNDLDIEPSFTRIASLQQLLKQQKGSIIQLGNGWTAERLTESVALKRTETVRLFREISIPKEGTYSIGSIVLTIAAAELPNNKRRGNPSEEYVDATKVIFPLTVRHWRSGDSFRPIGMKGSRKLSDFFSGLKLSQDEKKATPVLECSGGIVWVLGKRLDDRFKITDSTTSTYHLTVKTNGKKNDHR